MSLQRILSIESMERHPRALSPALSERRKMSFNPIADVVPPAPPPKMPVGATEVSAAKRIGMRIARGERVALR